MPTRTKKVNHLAVKKIEHDKTWLRPDEDVISYVLRRDREQCIEEGIYFAKTLLGIKDAAALIDKAIFAIPSWAAYKLEPKKVGESLRSVSQGLERERQHLFDALQAAIFPDEKETEQEAIKRLGAWGKQEVPNAS